MKTQQSNQKQVSDRLNARQLREVSEQEAQKKSVSISRKPLFFILENIYDTYNIGGLFRLADAVASSKMYLCGQTEIPPNSRIKKASIGTYKIVPWEYCKTVKDAVEKLRLEYKKERVEVIAVEQSPKSVNFQSVEYRLPTALIVGNETFGVSEETLSLADSIVEIPMWGINKSLNVIISAGIVTYELLRQVSSKS